MSLSDWLLLTGGVGVVLLAGLALWTPWAMRWRTTHEERRGPMPGTS